MDLAMLCGGRGRWPSGARGPPPLGAPGGFGNVFLIASLSLQFIHKSTIPHGNVLIVCCLHGGNQLGGIVEIKELGRRQGSWLTHVFGGQKVEKKKKKWGKRWKKNKNLSGKMEREKKQKQIHKVGKRKKKQKKKKKDKGGGKKKSRWVGVRSAFPIDRQQKTKEGGLGGGGGGGGSRGGRARENSQGGGGGLYSFFTFWTSARPLPKKKKKKRKKGPLTKKVRVCFAPWGGAGKRP